MDFTILKFISTQLSDPTQFFELNWINLKELTVNYGGFRFQIRNND
jgi:hypothetical protein